MEVETGESKKYFHLLFQFIIMSKNRNLHLISRRFIHKALLRRICTFSSSMSPKATPKRSAFLLLVTAI